MLQPREHICNDKDILWVTKDVHLKWINYKAPSNQGIGGQKARCALANGTSNPLTHSLLGQLPLMIAAIS